MIKKYWIATTIILILITLGIFIFSSSARNIIFSSNSSIGQIVNSKFSIISNFLSDLKSIKNITGENKRLQEKINELDAQIAKYKEIERENKTLKEELKFFDSQKNRNLLGAEVISKSVSPFLDYFLIDKGKVDGVEIGKIVIAQGYLVGKISQVYDNFSQIELITDSKTIIPVILQQSRATGLLKANLKGLYIDNIPIDSQLAEGEVALTSNLDKNIPPDISVGKIGKIISYSSQIFKSAEVNSPINFFDLKFVFIIRN